MLLLGLRVHAEKMFRLLKNKIHVLSDCVPLCFFFPTIGSVSFG